MKPSLAWMMGLLGALALPAPLHAESGNHRSNQPGATLLLPYFEVALPKKPNAKQKGMNTVFTIDNATASGEVAHVTVWSDLSVPVVAFDVYLSGYDSQTIDLFEIFSGRLPQTASVGQDPDDSISPKGTSSQDLNFPGCTGTLPPVPLTEGELDHVHAALTGKPSALAANQCLGRDLGEKKPLARGFVTVDTILGCTTLFPSQGGYTDILRKDNTFFGHWYVTDTAKKTLYGDEMVAVRADETEFADGDYTFYARFLASSAVDDLQPLATAYAARFANDPKDPFFPGGSRAIVWRDPKKPQGPFDCAAPPTALAQEQIAFFDDEEQLEILPDTTFPFPAAAQIVPIGGDELPVTFTGGWIRAALGTQVDGQTVTPSDPVSGQAWITMVHSNRRHPTALTATALDDANAPDHVIVEVP
jgi:hypothetical protein